MKGASASVRSLAQLLVEQPAAPPACLLEPGLLPPQGILFVGGEPKVGKSLLVANLALSLAAGVDRLGFPIPAPRRVLVCQFELPVAQFVSRVAGMRRALGSAADQRLFEAAEVLKAPRARIFRTVTLSGAKFGLISAGVVVFTLVVTDFGIPKVIGGSFNVLATDVYKQVVGRHNFNMGAVVGMLLLVPAVGAFVLERWAQRRQFSALSGRAVPKRETEAVGCYIADPAALRK